MRIRSIGVAGLLVGLGAFALFPHPGETTEAPSVGYDKEVLFVVGITKSHGTWKGLPNARPDAEAFARWMKARGAEVFDLWDAEATEQAIYDEIKKAQKAAKGRPGQDRTLLVVYFSGHGTPDHIVPYGARGEADYIPMERLRRWGRPNNGVRHQLYILGSCYSGSLFRSEELKSPRFLRRYAKNPAGWFAQSLRRVARMALSAGRDDEIVPDGRGGEGSRFGNAVLRAVDKAPGAPFANADVNEDGCVSSYELARYVHDNGSHDGVTHPYFGPLPGDRQGVIAFCDRRLGPEPPPVAVVGPRRSGEVMLPQSEARPPVDSAAPRRSGAVMLPKSDARPAMLFIRGGRFTMGSPPHEPGRSSDEEQYEVSVRDFWMARTEVTQGQWTKVMGSNPSRFVASNGGGPNHPVEQVSVWGALAYLNKLSKRETLGACYDLRRCSRKDGLLECSLGTLEPKPGCRGYRLPTEPEWEYAARGGTPTALYAGPIRYEDANKFVSAEVAALAWYDGNSEGRTHSVGAKPANPFGLVDVLGNVWEWTGSRGSRGLNEKRVVNRGCGWSNIARSCRAAYRNAISPGFRDSNLGFRPARSIP